jgi:DNA photolyase
MQYGDEQNGCAFAAGEDGGDVWTGEAWRPGGASLLWVQQALESMSADLQARYGHGARIAFIRSDTAAEALLPLCKELSVSHVTANLRHEPQMRAADEQTSQQLHTAGIKVRRVLGADRVAPVKAPAMHCGLRCATTPAALVRVQSATMRNVCAMRCGACPMRCDTHCA